MDSCISQTLKTPRGSREVAVQPSPLIPTVRFPHLIKKVSQDFSSKLQQPCTLKRKSFRNKPAYAVKCIQHSQWDYMAIRKYFWVKQQNRKTFLKSNAIQTKPAAPHDSKQHSEVFKDSSMLTSSATLIMLTQSSIMPFWHSSKYTGMVQSSYTH